MSNWPSSKANRVLAALYRIGWRLKRQSGSHKTLTRPGWPDVVFAFHDREEIGPRMLARIAKRSGLKPDNFHDRFQFRHIFLRTAQQWSVVPEGVDRYEEHFAS